MNADIEPDADRDGLGDETQDADTDGDGVEAGDNCKNIANPDQRDSDGDGLGDACEEDGERRRRAERSRQLSHRGQSEPGGPLTATLRATPATPTTTVTG